MHACKLSSLLERLSMNAVESVQDGKELSSFDQYMHVSRPIEEKLLGKMQAVKSAGGGIVLLVGSAGDGKSHLLSVMRTRFSELGFSYYNDATASSSPHKTSIDTLIEELQDFCDESIENTNRRLVIAINIGKLNLFIHDERAQNKYKKLISVAGRVFDSINHSDSTETERIKILRFDNEQVFEFDSTQEVPVDSIFLKNLIAKIVCNKSDNPFYSAYCYDKQSGFQENNPIIINYELLLQPSIQESIIKYVIESAIRFKVSITARDFIDFIHSILVPPNEIPSLTDVEYYDGLLPTLLFSGKRNHIQRVLSNLDPVKHFCSQHEEDLSILYNGVDESDAYFKLKGITGVPEKLSRTISHLFSDSGIAIDPSIRFIIRFQHVLCYHSESSCYKSFTKLLYGISQNNRRDIGDIYALVENYAVPRHHGSYWSSPNVVPLNIRGQKFQLYAKAALKPYCIKSYGYDTGKENFFSQFTLSWNGGAYTLVIDYTLYEYMYELRKGKLPTIRDTERIFTMERFIQDILRDSSYDTELLISCPDGGSMTLSYNPNIGSITLS